MDIVDKGGSAFNFVGEQVLRELIMPMVQSKLEHTYKCDLGIVQRVELENVRKADKFVQNLEILLYEERLN